MRSWGVALAVVFEGWSYRLLFAATAVLVTLLYSVLLPFQYTQRLSIQNWRYLDSELVAFSLVFGLLLAWLLTTNVYALRCLARRSNASASAGAVVGTLAGEKEGAEAELDSLGRRNGRGAGCRRPLRPSRPRRRSTCQQLGAAGDGCAGLRRPGSLLYDH